MQSTNEMTHDSDHDRQRRLSGKNVVFGMFAFAVLMVGALWIYWELYTRPFRTLQNAIAAAYPDCHPHVVGGKQKSHLDDHPDTLRITVRLPATHFDPSQQQSQSEEMAKELVQLAENNILLDQYEQLEIHLTQAVPEQTTRHWGQSRPVEEWRKLVEKESSNGDSPDEIPSEATNSPAQ
ncbi:hypothetical protein SH668x_000746 [Planctomicrobium sp. SH668]|uniref:hypothetical protein n=1 Tax=Planctomicrobium sp. SH668 TaxID=3448126 RepID=UPI003F5C8785